MLRHFAAAVAISLAMALPAQATVIVDRSVLPAGVDGAYCSSCNNGAFRGFAQFSTPSDAMLTSLTYQAFGNAIFGITNINVSIWSSDRSAVLFQEDFAPGDVTSTVLGPWPTNPFIIVTSEQLALPNWLLPAGSYQLSVYATGVGQPVSQLSWVTAPGGSDLWINGGGVEEAFGGSFGFRLEGTVPVPEPASLSIFAAGLAMLAWRRRRQPAPIV